MTDAEKLERGHKAIQLKSNQVFMDAVRAVRNRLFVEWLNSGSGNVGEREGLYKESQVLNKIVSELQSYIDDVKQIKNLQAQADAEYGIL